jgi:hypothetical protein
MDQRTLIETEWISMTSALWKSRLTTPLATALLLGVLGGSPAFAASDSLPAPAPQDAAASAPALPSIAGTWRLTWTSKQGQQRNKLVQLQQTGNTLTGSAQGKRGTNPLAGRLNGNQITFHMNLPKRRMRFTGSIDGNLMSGTTRSGLAWSAARQ